MSEGSGVVAVVGLVAAACVVWVVPMAVRALRKRRVLYREMQAAEVAQRAFQREITAAARMDSRGVDELLGHLKRETWTVHAFPNRREPDVLAYTRDLGRYTDVVILRGEDQAAAFRVPTSLTSVMDVLAPNVVVWFWVGSADVAMRQMFALPLPGDERAPVSAQPAPPHCGVSPEERHRVTWRPLSDRGGR